MVLKNMEKYITSELEKRLAAFDDVSPIINDTQLKAALNKIIEETEPKTDADVALIDEAVEMLLELENVDVDELELSSEAWAENYKTAHKLCSEIKVKKNKNKKSIRIKWLMPVAALLSILCITVIVSSAVGVDVWNLTKEFYSSLTEKVTHFFNGSSIISTTDYKKYKSLEDLIEQENLSDILLPLDMPEDYMVDNLSYDDFDNIKRINMDVLKKGQKIASICIKTSYNANFEETKITEVCGFNGYETHYDDVYQFEFDYLTDYYIVYSNDHDELVCILDSLLGVS